MSNGTHSFSRRTGPRSPVLKSLELHSPPLPSTLTQTAELLEHPERLEVGPVTELVQRDPIVVARLLHIVNSAYYGLQRSISSVERAVVLLGPVAVTGIIMGMDLMKLRASMDEEARTCFMRLMRHSIATAFLTRHLMEGISRGQLAEIGGYRRVGESFTAGMLHDLGKIILMYNYPVETTTLYTETALDEAGRHQDIRVLETATFGCSHTEAGISIARKLGYPDLLANVILYHHEPLDNPGGSVDDSGRTVRAAAAANTAAKAMGYGFPLQITPEECAGLPIWDHIARLDLAEPVEPAALVEEVLSQQDYVDEYVGSMTGASPDPESD